MDGKPNSAVIHLTAKKIFIIIVSLQLALLGLIPPHLQPPYRKMGYGEGVFQ